MTPVNVEAAVWMLTGLALLVVVLTRLRLSARTEQSGVARVPQSVVNGHTVVGLLAVLTWSGYLTRVGSELNLIVGAVALVLWWVEAVIGLLILARWRTARGRHASPRRGDHWGKNPWLSALAHLGLLGAACCFTALLVSDVW
jgi:quinol-cytochrome oxidoreductase complex cytochrome b subunit